MRFLLLSVVLLASGCSTLITQEPSGSGEAKSVFQYELGREYRTENEGPAHIVTCSKAPLLPSEARARLAQVHKGMQRADVERILGPQENGIALSTSGLLSDYYLLTPDVRVRVDYMLQNVSSARYSEHDVVVRKPDTLSVKTEPEGQNRIRWVNVPVPQVEWIVHEGGTFDTGFYTVTTPPGDFPLISQYSTADFLKASS